MTFNLSITIIAFSLFAIAIQSTSNYKKISWDEKRQLWKAEFSFNGKISKSYFENEFDAAKRINQLCKNMGIPSKNPELPEIPNQQKGEETSQYKGVYWHKKSGKWKTQLSIKRQSPKYGGCFNDELDAAKRVNQLCEEIRISQKNPGIGAVPNPQAQTKQKTSQYKGVCWNKKHKKWYAEVSIGQGNKIHGGVFKNELDAAKRVNEICEEHKIPLKNPGIKTFVEVVPNEDDKNKTVTQSANPMNDFKIAKNDDDDANEKKRKRKKDFIKKYFLNLKKSSFFLISKIDTIKKL